MALGVWHEPCAEFPRMLCHVSVRDRNRSSDAGFSLVEIMAASLVLAILVGFVGLIVGNLAGHYRLSGDARGVSNSVAVAKLRAASLFTQTRLYANISGNSYRIQIYQKTGTPGWVTEGTSYTLSNGVAFGFGSVTTPPPNSQATIAQAAPCRDDSGNDISGTACVVFNSRGLPVDSTGTPTGIGAFYLTDNNAVFAVTVSATGMLKFWRATSSGTTSWGLQ